MTIPKQAKTAAETSRLQRKKMSIESDNESLHSSGNVDENKTGGNDLTVKIPSLLKSDPRRSSKPVKLKRKSYDIGSKQKADKDGGTEDQEPDLPHSKLEILSSHPISSSYPTSPYPASSQSPGASSQSPGDVITPTRETSICYLGKSLNPSRDKMLKMIETKSSFKDSSSASSNREKNFRNNNNNRRKITLPGNKEKSPFAIAVSDGDGSKDVPGISSKRNTHNAAPTTQRNERMKPAKNNLIEVIEVDKVDKQIVGNVSSHTKTTALEKKPVNVENIQVSISDGLSRSSVLLGKDGPAKRKAGNALDMPSESVNKNNKYEDIGSSSALDDTSEPTKINQPLNEVSNVSTEKKSKSDDAKKTSNTKRLPEKGRRSPEKSSRSSKRRESSKERNEKERRSSRDDQKRDRKRSPIRHSPNRSRSPLSRNRSTFNRRAGFNNVRRFPDRGGWRGSFDYRRGRFGAVRGGRGNFGAWRNNGPPLPMRRFPVRRNERNRSADYERRRDSPSKETSKSRSSVDKHTKAKKALLEKKKKSLKPTKEEIEKMEEELKKIDLMIEIRKTKKKTGDKLTFVDESDTILKEDILKEIDEMVLPQCDDVEASINVAIHSAENFPLEDHHLPPSEDIGEQKPTENKAGFISDGEPDNDSIIEMSEDTVDDKYLREKLDHIKSIREKISSDLALSDLSKANREKILDLASIDLMQSDPQHISYSPILSRKKLGLGETSPNFSVLSDDIKVDDDISALFNKGDDDPIESNYGRSTSASENKGTYGNYGSSENKGTYGNYGSSEDKGTYGNYGSSGDKGTYGNYGSSEDKGTYGNYGSSEDKGTYGNYGSSENKDSALNRNDQVSETHKESEASNSSDGESEVGSNKEDRDVSHAENSDKESEAHIENEKEENSSSESDEESNKSSSTSVVASDASASGASEDSESDNSDSDSSEESEPAKKKHSKKKKSKKKKQRSSSNSENESDSLSEAASNDSDRSSKKKKRKRKKKKKRRSKTKRSARKHKKDEKSIVLNESQFTAFLDKVKESLREEIVKEFQPQTGGSEASISRKKAKPGDAASGDGKDAEIADSSDEFELEMSTHHGFPTGIPLRKDAAELGELKGSDDNLERVGEEVFNVFKSDDELDDELDQDNWKRHKKKDDSNMENDNRRSKNKRSKEHKLSRRKKIVLQNDAKDIVKHSSKDIKGVGDKDGEYISNEQKEKKRLSDRIERDKEDIKKRTKVEEKDISKNRKSSLDHPSEKSVIDRDRRKSSPRPPSIDDSLDKSNQYLKSSRSAERHHPKEMRLPGKQGQQPHIDGMAIATQVRNDVYKLNDFWNGSAKKRPTNIDSAEHVGKHKESNILEPIGRWEAPFSDINNRLQKIADQKFLNERNAALKKRLKSSESEKLDEPEKRVAPSKNDGDKGSDMNRILNPENSRIDKDLRNRSDSGINEKKGINKHLGDDKRYSAAKADRSAHTREREPVSGQHNVDRMHSSDRDNKRDHDRTTSSTLSRTNDRKNIDRSDSKTSSSSNPRTEGGNSKDQRSRELQSERRYDGKEDRRDSVDKNPKDRKDDERRRSDDKRPHGRLSKERDGIPNKDKDRGKYEDPRSARPDKQVQSRNERSTNYDISADISNTSSRVPSDGGGKKDYDKNNLKETKKSLDKIYSSCSSDSSDSERNIRDRKSKGGHIKHKSTSYTRPEKNYRGSKKTS